MSVPADRGFRTRVAELLRDLVDAVRTDTAPPAEALGLVNLTTLPVYRVANVAAASPTGTLATTAGASAGSSRSTTRTVALGTIIAPHTARLQNQLGIGSYRSAWLLAAKLRIPDQPGVGGDAPLQALVVNTTAFPTRSPANPGFVHLNMVLGLSTDPVLVGPHHARAELVENLKGRLVARKTKLPLKLHGGHAGRLTGDQISGPEPDVQRSVATLHHCSHRQPGVLAALAAAQDARAVFKVERLSRRAAVRAGKAVSPAGFLQVGGAGRIIGEKSLELGYPFNAFRSLLGIAGDTSGPTYAELYSGEWRHPTCSGHGR